jgi:hypothetical protein
MFTGFHAYDDEGYFLVTLRDYLSGQPLLSPAAPVNGPFFYETIGGLFKLLGAEPGHDAGRYLTLAIWVIGSVIAGLTAYRLTRSLWLGLSALLVMFHVLGALTTEPASPSGMVSLLLIILVAAASLRSERPRAMAAIIGAIVGALCLTKINVGGFAAFAVIFAWAGSLAPRWRRVLLPASGLAITLLPVVLTSPLLGRAWVWEFAAGLALSGFVVAITCLTFASRPMPPASSTWLAVGGVVLVVTCAVIAVAGGSNVRDWWNALVVVPLRIPHLITWPLQVNFGLDLWAAAMLIAAVATRYLVRLPPVIAGVTRVAAGLFTLFAALLLPSSIFMLAVPLAWIASVRPSREEGDPVGGYCRLLLPALAVLAALQAYPVAGTELSLSAVALVPVGAVILGDGIRELRGIELRRTARFAAWAAPAALLVNIQVLLLIGYLATAGFFDATPLGLPGAGSVRLPAQNASDLRGLVAAIDRDCSEFITYPGMNSLYFWTGQKPPTDVRSEIWMITFDDAAQQSLVQQLQRMPRLCAVKNQHEIDFWTRGAAIPDRPLVRFIDGGFSSDGTFGDYALLTRNPSGAAP